MTKDRVIERVLFGHDPYLSVNLIKKYEGCSHEKAKEIFKLAKENELKKSQIDARPEKVHLTHYFKVVGRDYSYEVRRYKARKENVSE